MFEYLTGFIKEIALTKRIGIFGTGEASRVAEDFLTQIGINDYVFWDNDRKKIEQGIFHGKKVLNPNAITVSDYILVSTVYWKEIKRQLENQMQLLEFDNFLWAFELEYYDFKIKHKDMPKVPSLSWEDLDEIEVELKKYVDVESIDELNHEEFALFEEKLNFTEVYDKENNKRYCRKILEYYFANKILNIDKWDKNNIYLDVGAANSPWAKYLREEKGMDVYAIDLSKGLYSELSYYIEADATQMPFEEESVTAMSLQSTFEMFVGNADIDFIKEASRVLKKGGKVIISPLYMHKKYLSTVSPNYYNCGYADEGSIECIREDCGRGCPLGRFYDVQTLYERVIMQARSYGLQVKIYSLINELVEKDGFVYLKFILEMTK